MSQFVTSNLTGGKTIGFSSVAFGVLVLSGAPRSVTTILRCLFFGSLHVRLRKRDVCFRILLERAFLSKYCSVMSIESIKVRRKHQFPSNIRTVMRLPRAILINQRIFRFRQEFFWMSLEIGHIQSGDNSVYRYLYFLIELLLFCFILDYFIQVRSKFIDVCV